MAKKVEAIVRATLTKNQEKGGAWLCHISMGMAGIPNIDRIQAWSNASAGKRWVKAWVVENTPRKSIKMVVTKKDLNDKAMEISGELIYKVAS